jgi:hypothetical protein
MSVRMYSAEHRGILKCAHYIDVRADSVRHQVAKLFHSAALSEQITREAGAHRWLARGAGQCDTALAEERVMGGRFYPIPGGPEAPVPDTERAYNSMESPPAYCYSPQAEDVLRLCRLLHIMSPLREVRTKDMIRCREFRFPHPIFFHVVKHPHPVPRDFWPLLRENHAVIAMLEFT